MTGVLGLALFAVRHPRDVISVASAHPAVGIGHRAVMDRPVVAAVETEEDVRLWAAPRMIVVTQSLAGVVFLVMALVNLLGDHPSGWQRFIGVVAAVVAGMAFGVAGSLRLQGRMVRQHLDTCHSAATPAGTVPSEPTLPTVPQPRGR